MKCPTCGASQLIDETSTHLRCSYCQTSVDKKALEKASSHPSPHAPDSHDYSHYESSVVNLLTDRGNGTGFIIHERGWVLTNHHVIQDDLIVHGIVGNQTNTYELEVLATGQSLGIDIALLEILNPDRSFIAIHPANKAPRLGDLAVTIGNPKNLGISLSKGSVSRQTDDVLQLDLTVNAGNSGGPVLNELGRCIGVISYKQSDIDGYCFAVPLTQIKSFLAHYQRSKETL